MKQKNKTFQKMLQAIQEFRDARDWAQYHTPKDLAMDVVREASEAMECLLWITNEQAEQDEERKEDIAKELADVLHSLLLLSDKLEIDLEQSFWDKLKEIKKRYPAKEFRSKSTYQFKKEQRKLS